MNELDKFKKTLSLHIYQSKILDAKFIPTHQAMILTLISGLQIIILSIIGFAMTLENFNDPFAKTILQICKYFLFILNFDAQKLNPLDIVAFIVVSLYSLFVSVGMVLIAIWILKSKELPLFFRNYTSPINYTHILIFFLPIQNTIFSLFFKIINDSKLRIETGYIIVVCICLLATIINAGFGLGMALYTVCLKTKDKFSRLSNADHMILVLQKLFLSLLYYIHENDPSNNSLVWYYNLLLLLTNSLKTYRMKQVPPYFSKKLSIINAYSYTISVTISVWSIITLIANQEEMVLTSGHFLYIIFLISPFVSRAFDIILTQRKILGLIDKNKSKTHTYLWASYIMSSKKILSGQDLTTKDKKFKKKEIENIIIAQAHQRDGLIDNKDALINYLYNLSIQKKNLPALINLVIAELLLKLNALPQGYSAYKKVMNSENLSYSEQLSAFMLRDQVQLLVQRIHKENSELAGFMDSVSSHHKLNEMILKAADEREKFYKMLISPEDPCLYKVILAAKNIQLLEVKINSLWDSLSKRNADSYPPLIKIFALFKIFVEMKSESGRLHMMQYKKIIEKKLAKQSSKAENIFSDKNVYIIAGADTHNLGKILSATYNIKNMFGKSSADVVGKNLQILMTDTYSNSHSELMRQRLSDSNKLKRAFQIETLAKHSEGHIFPIKLFVTLHPNISDGLSFWGMIRSLNSQLDHFILDKDGFIEGASYILKHSFNFSVDKQVHIGDLGNIYDKSEIKKISLDLARYQPKTTLRSPTKANNPNFEEDYTAIGRKKFLSVLNEQIEMKIEFAILFFPEKLKRNSPNKYRCSASSTEYFGKKVYIITMSRVFQNFASQTKGSKTPNSIHKGENFSQFAEKAIEKTKYPSLTYSPDLKSRTLRNRTTSFPKLQLFKVVDDSNSNNQNNIEEEEINEQEVSSASSIKQSGFEDSENISDKIVHEKARNPGRKDFKDEQDLQETLKEIVQSTNYYKFYKAYILLGGLIAVIFIFLYTILQAYLDTTASIDDVTNRMNAIFLANLRGRDLAMMFFYLYPVYTFEKILMNPDNFLALGSLNQLDYFSKDLITQNKELENIISRLTDEERDFFFRKNVRMYTSNFDQIPNTTTYEDTNQFTLFKGIFSRSSHYISNYFSNSNSKDYALDFMFGNVMNDLWIATLKGPDVLKNAVQKEVDSTINENQKMLILSLVFVLALIVCAFIINPISYYESITLLEQVINSGSSEMIQSALNDLQVFREFIEKKMHGKELISVKAKEKSKSKLAMQNFEKKGKRGEMFGKSMKRFLGTILMQICPIILIFLSFSKFQQSTSQIIPIINDINNLNNITFNALSMHSYLGLLSAKPDTIVMNHKLEEILDQAFIDYRESVSTIKNFQPRTLNFLNSPYCSYYTAQALYTDCTVLFRKLGLKGIQSTILEAVEYHLEYRKKITDTYSTPQSVAYFLFQPMNLELFCLVGYGVADAIISFQKEMVVELIDNLQSASTDIAIIFIISVFGGLIAFVISWVIFRVTLEERKWISGCLTILPLKLVMTNKGFRFYLLNDSKIFYKMVIKYEKYKTNQSN